MDSSQQVRMDAVETKTDMLESVLAQFISSTNKMVQRLEADTIGFKNEMKDFKDEMKDFKDEMKDFKDEMKDFKDEMKDFKDEMKEFKDESRRSSKEMNKKWGELSNKLGTFVEDIVVPNIRGIARDYFHDDDFKTFGPRVLKRSVNDRTVRREFDVVGETDGTFFINETKSKPRPEDVKAFRDMLEVVPDFFPDSRGKRLIPIFSSLYIPEDIKTNLTRHGIYALGMKEGTMDLLNFREVAGTETAPSDSVG